MVPGSCTAKLSIFYGAALFTKPRAEDGWMEPYGGGPYRQERDSTNTVNNLMITWLEVQRNPRRYKTAAHPLAPDTRAARSPRPRFVSLDFSLPISLSATPGVPQQSW